MLGRLLGAASSLNPLPKNTSNLESVTDEQATRGLLFPDSNLPQQPQPSAHLRLLNEYDDRGGGLELDATRDFRIIIAQDAIGDLDNPCVLLDTHTTWAPSTTTGVGVKTAQEPGGGHKRVPSIVQSPLLNKSPLSPRPDQPPPISRSLGTFQSRNRSSTVAGAPAGSDSREPDGKDTSKSFLSSMFGASKLSATSSSTTTKMHVISADPMNTSQSVTNPNSVRPIDTQALGDSRRREPLTRAHTSGTQPSTRLGSILESGGQTQDTVLITRMFNVLLPEAKEPVSDVVEVSNAKPDAAAAFPSLVNNSTEVQKRKKPKELKTPAFAVSILIQLPQRQSSSRPNSHSGARSPRIPQLSESIPSSYGSDLQSSWAFLESMPLSLSLSQTLLDGVDNRVEYLVDHWDVITRALSVLERGAHEKILGLLKADLVSAAPQPKPAKEKSMQRTNQINRRLAPWALAQDLELRDASLQTIKRIAGALRIPKAVTGFGLARGGPWVEEARCVARVCGGREQDFFLFNLLTAFLGSHTEWLSLLGPEWYRRRHRVQQKLRQEAEPILSRTIIVCNERSIGRRLVFLLASFLPSHSHADVSASPLRPSTSFSTKQASSQSPPLGQLSRQQSLRRTINRRTRDSRLATQGPNKQVLSTSASSNDGETGGFRFAKEVLGKELQRKDSGSSRSMTTTSMLPVPTNDLSLRKSSAGTTSTVTPDPTTPVAYLTSGVDKMDSYFPAGLEMPSTDSFASTNLARHLRHPSGHSAHLGSEHSTGSTKWGSLLSGVSGLWSAKNGTSSPTSEFPASASLRYAKSRPCSVNETARRPASRNVLEDMANEVGQDHDLSRDQRRPSENDDFRWSPDIQESPKPKALPLRMKVDENDGVVDVDIQLPGFFSSSLESGPMSPQPRMARHTPSLTSLDGLAASMRSSTSNFNPTTQHEPHSQSNVAGFLRRYHQDFALQSVRPYPEIEAEVRRSMLAELTPAHAPICANPVPESSGQWVDVCTTLIADVRSFQVKRLSLKRKKPLSTGPFGQEGSLQQTSSNQSTASLSRTSLESFPEEVIIAENVMDLDTVLTDAIERILNDSTGNSSRQSSPTRMRHSRNPSSSTTSTMQTQPLQTSKASVSKDSVVPVLDFPRQESRRMVVSALEEVVKSVNEDLNGNPNGRDIRRDSYTSGEGPKEVKHEENALREGVKRWLISVEHTEVW